METHRYKQVADALQLSINQFEKEIGVKQSRISKAVQRNADISEDIVLRITTKYPNINRVWLLTGIGEMFTTTADKVHDLAKGTGKPHGANKSLREAIKQFILGDWLTYERNAKEIEEMAEIIKLLEQKKNDKNQ